MKTCSTIHKFAIVIVIKTNWKCFDHNFVGNKRLASELQRLGFIYNP